MPFVALKQACSLTVGVEELLLCAMLSSVTFITTRACYLARFIQSGIVQLIHQCERGCCRQSVTIAFPRNFTACESSHAGWHVHCSCSCYMLRLNVLRTVDGDSRTSRPISSLFGGCLLLETTAALAVRGLRRRVCSNIILT